MEDKKPHKVFRKCEYKEAEYVPCPNCDKGEMIHKEDEYISLPGEPKKYYHNCDSGCGHSEYYLDIFPFQISLARDSDFPPGFDLNKAIADHRVRYDFDNNFDLKGGTKPEEFIPNLKVEPCAIKVTGWTEKTKGHYWEIILNTPLQRPLTGLLYFIPREYPDKIIYTDGIVKVSSVEGYVYNFWQFGAANHFDLPETPFEISLISAPLDYVQRGDIGLFTYGPPGESSVNGVIWDKPVAPFRRLEIGAENLLSMIYYLYELGDPDKITMIFLSSFLGKKIPDSEVENLIQGFLKNDDRELTKNEQVEVTALIRNTFNDFKTKYCK